MKVKIIIIALVAALSLNGNMLAQSNIPIATNLIKPIKSSASEVTLFLSGAQVQREVTVQISAGENILKFENLSPYIQQNSIQARANKGLTILSVNYEHNYLAKTESSQEVEKLTTKLEQLQEQLTLENAHLNVVKEDIAFLQANRDIGGQNNTLTVAALQQTSEFYSKNFTELKIKEIKRTKTIKKLSDQQDSLKRQIQQWTQDKNIPSGEIIIKVKSPTATTYNLELTYIVENAGWTPSYDIRVQSINEPIKLAYKATVTQNTRENWENVKLRFSSANPNLSGVAPILYPYYLRYPRPVQDNSLSRSLQGRVGGVQVNDNVELKMSEELTYSSAPTFTTENQTTVEFEIGAPYTIYSDGKEYKVDMNIIEMPASYQYYSVPKLEKDAFLIAKATEWEKYNLLDGEANIFFEGTFVGKTFLEMSSAKDTLELSLGRDKSISIKREKVKGFTTKQFIGSKQEEEVSWKITVKNSKNLDINILLVDQAPLSTIEEIEVSVKSSFGAKHNAQTGQVQWELTLKPLETRELTLTYTVKYPKYKSLIIQ